LSVRPFIALPEISNTSHSPTKPRAMKASVAYSTLGMLLLISWLSIELSAGTVAESKSGYATLVYLLGFISFVICTLAFFICLRRPPITGFVFGMLAVGLGLFGILPGGDGIVEHITSPDGTEMMITQEHNGEPYSVGFYFRKKGGNWGWFYYEHEDTRWYRSLSHIRLTEDARSATVYRLFWPVATFDLEQESFTLLRWGRPSRTQQLMPNNWSPKVTQKGGKAPGHISQSSHRSPKEAIESAVWQNRYILPGVCGRG
jgi:hypothetical protein